MITDKLFYNLALKAAMQTFAHRFGAGDQHYCSSIILAHVFRITAPAWSLFPESFKVFGQMVFYKYEILLLLFSASSVLLDPISFFVSVIRRSPRDSLCCFWNVQMWKLICSKAINPSSVPTLLKSESVDIAICEPSKCFQFWYPVWRRREQHSLLELMFCHTLAIHRRAIW